MITPLPSESVLPVWLFMPGCTAYYASIHHLTTLILSVPRVRQSCSAPLRKPIGWTNVFTSSSSSDCNRVVKNDIVTCISGLDCLLMKRIFAIYWWKSCALSFLSFLPFGFTISRWSAVHVFAGFMMCSGNSSSVFSMDQSIKTFITPFLCSRSTLPGTCASFLGSLPWVLHKTVQDIGAVMLLVAVCGVRFAGHQHESSWSFGSHRTSCLPHMSCIHWIWIQNWRAASSTSNRKAMHCSINRILPYSGARKVPSFHSFWLICTHNTFPFRPFTFAQLKVCLELCRPLRQVRYIWMLLVRLWLRYHIPPLHWL